MLKKLLTVRISSLIELGDIYRSITNYRRDFIDGVPSYYYFSRSIRKSFVLISQLSETVKKFMKDKNINPIFIHFVKEKKGNIILLTDSRKVYRIDEFDYKISYNQVINIYEAIDIFESLLEIGNVYDIKSVYLDELSDNILNRNSVIIFFKKLLYNIEMKIIHK